MSVNHNDVKFETTNVAQPVPGQVVYIERDRSNCEKCWDGLFCCCQAYLIAEGCARCMCCLCHLMECIVR
ncbi:unnamed protein product [Brachionus calyciflorus]|uniref:Uncharacterized protein n=1 Tax=Brachionus calyciflorus TaxID=104777 RepID=A0A814MZ68_9BILA|nr:unnamed protein product [Brachionus calyciflorus]